MTNVLHVKKGTWESSQEPFSTLTSDSDPLLDDGLLLERGVREPFHLDNQCDRPVITVRIMQ